MKYAAVAIVTALMLLSASCQTTTEATPEVEPPRPDIAFPTFPPPDSVFFLEAGTEIVIPATETEPEKRIVLESDYVYMPLDYWLSVTDYVIDVRRAERIYAALREGAKE